MNFPFPHSRPGHIGVPYRPPSAKMMKCHKFWQNSDNSATEISSFMCYFLFLSPIFLQIAKILYYFAAS